MDHNNTYNINTDNNKTDDSNLILSSDEQRYDERLDPEAELIAIQELIKDNIDYDCLLERYSTERETIKGIYDLIVETVLASGEKLLIASNWYPTALVKSKFMKKCRAF